MAAGDKAQRVRSEATFAKKEAFRCHKRYIAREVDNVLPRAQPWTIPRSILPSRTGLSCLHVSGARIDHLNIVVAELDAAVKFLIELGVDIPVGPVGWEAWDPHHRTISEPSFGIDLDSSAFAHQWGGLGPTFNGVVVNLRADDRSDVDRLYELALSIGGRSRRSPYDAFWGARYALVEGPGPIAVGIMSARDDAHRSDPPDLASFS